MNAARFRQRFRALLAVAWLLMAGVAVACPGCAWFDQFRGEGFHDDLSHTGEKLRPASDAPPGPAGSGAFSTKSRQIERDLGL
ncbi:MAG: hypothetical protein K8T25_05960 [Planctomycetia bacterium]|nr:hypothetical protein [Planctomycetia bacterium]